MKTKAPFSGFLNAFHKTKARVQRKLVEPEREWVMCLGVTFVLSCMLMVYAGYDFYIQYSRVDAGTTLEVNEENFRFKEKQAESIIDRFTTRDETFRKLQSESMISEPKRDESSGIGEVSTSTETSSVNASSSALLAETIVAE